ncbi:unnamed protein product [Rotaria sp. Silwood1]|nr:unnamed protein product [Rotaria sp. Silwood1]CAF3587666.1 unnamed protein product [Rotaria sp. Silwood1]CAF4582067.1 unnamed protein product [Rotaria sp. Silwood1]
MAIDMNTGDILLPALSLTQGTSTWQDRESGQIFLISNEVIITNPPANDNNVSINIFPTENDLVQVWLNNYKIGQWSGGEFARRKDVSDVYDKFFKDGQATAISQEYKVLYTISMKSANNSKALVLNEYARAAIAALTINYDDILYNNFIDASGTHITVSNKVGGMIEQQVIFKNCMINTTNLTDGIKQSALERNLKRELLSRQPCIDHFYWLRRRKLLDHRIGGNVLLVNNTDEWKKTIVLNPALLSISKYISWYDVVTNTNIQNNLRRAIENRITLINTIRQEQVRKIQEERANMSLSAQVLYGYLMREKVNGTTTPLGPNTKGKDWVEIKQYSFSENMALASSQECPTGIESNLQLALSCSAGERKMGACAIKITNSDGMDTVEVTREVPIAYERNHTTGSFRIVARRQYGKMVYGNPEMQFINYDVEGNWVDVGCSEINNKCLNYSTAYNTTADIKTVYLCSGCDVRCTDVEKKQCNCYCPIYKRDPDGVFEPYCGRSD